MKKKRNPSKLFREVLWTLRNDISNEVVTLENGNWSIEPVSKEELHMLPDLANFLTRNGFIVHQREGELKVFLNKEIKYDNRNSNDPNNNMGRL